MLVALYGELACGYRTELLGVAVPGIPERREPMPFYGSPLGTVQVWAQRAVHEVSGIVSEIRWHPTRAPRTVLWNPELATFTADIDIARRGLELIAEGEREREASAREGRPLGSYKITWPEVVGASWTLWYDRPHLWTQTLLAEICDISAPTLTNRIRQAEGVPLKPTK